MISKIVQSVPPSNAVVQTPNVVGSAAQQISLSLQTSAAAAAVPQVAVDVLKAPPQAAAPETVQVAISRLNTYVQNQRRDLQFQVDDDSGEVVVKVVDPETQEVIRQIPSEEAVALAKALREEMAGGGLFRETA